MVFCANALDVAARASITKNRVAKVSFLVFIRSPVRYFPSAWTLGPAQHTLLAHESPHHQRGQRSKPRRGKDEKIMPLVR